MTMFLVLMALISSASAATNQDMIVATQEMQKANYFTFVTLINMAPSHSFQENITFLMPNDRALSNVNMAQTQVKDFLLRHAIPSPLLIDHLDHFPTGSMVPTLDPGFMFKVTNNGRRQFFLSNVRIISPNICTKGSSIRCHGIDGVVQPMMVPQPGVRPTPTCSTPPVEEAPSPPQGVSSGEAPVIITAQAPSAVEVEPPTSSSNGIGQEMLVAFLVLSLVMKILV